MITVIIAWGAFLVGFVAGIWWSRRPPDDTLPLYVDPSSTVSFRREW